MTVKSTPARSYFLVLTRAGKAHLAFTWSPARIAICGQATGAGAAIYGQVSELPVAAANRCGRCVEIAAGL